MAVWHHIGSKFNQICVQNTKIIPLKQKGRSTLLQLTKLRQKILMLLSHLRENIIKNPTKQLEANEPN